MIVTQYNNKNIKTIIKKGSMKKYQSAFSLIFDVRNEVTANVVRRRSRKNLFRTREACEAGSEENHQKSNNPSVNQL